MAAKIGGSGDPDANFRLRLAMQKAKEFNMPMENVKRAIDKGTGKAEGMAIEEMTYEGFGPAGVAVLVEVATDNRNRIAAELRPGAIPSRIYTDIMKSLSPDFLENFMGFGNRRVRFLGHSIGLVIDEAPVIAEGFDEPLEEGMVFAVEPKKGISGIGMVGIENTFFVTKEGGRSITGHSRRLIQVSSPSQPQS